MSECCECEPAVATDHAYRRVLRLAFILNATMFVVESAAGHLAQSAALQADATDFLGDALNFASALYVLNKSLQWRSGAALIKGGVIGLFGLLVLGNTAYHWLHELLPAPSTMGVIGFLALAVNAGCASLLFRFRKGDSNRSSVWVCSRNDAIANILVIMAGVAVYFTESQLPDLIVSLIIAGLALYGAGQIIGKASQELRPTKSAEDKSCH